MDFLEIAIRHGWDKDKALKAKETANIYKHFSTGFVMVHFLKDYDVISSAAINNIYPRDMWRYIRSTLLNRQRPIVIHYSENYEKLIKASQRYGVIELGDGLVYFP